MHVTSTDTRRLIIETLIELGADVNAKNAYGATALHELSYKYCRRDVSDLMCALIVAGADINARTEDDETPLHTLARNDYIYDQCESWQLLRVEVTRILIDAGADVHARTKTIAHHCTVPPSVSK